MSDLSQYTAMYTMHTVAYSMHHASTVECF